MLEAEANSVTTMHTNACKMLMHDNARPRFTNKWQMSVWHFTIKQTFSTKLNTQVSELAVFNIPLNR